MNVISVLERGQACPPPQDPSDLLGAPGSLAPLALMQPEVVDDRVGRVRVMLDLDRRECWSIQSNP